MSEMKVSMKFEMLPNEILIECFEYLNALDTYQSFDQLNYRLNNLIRTVPLYLNFENIPQSTFNQFCMKLSSNQEMKQHIYSLHLSNADTCWQIQPFLTRFSLNEFIHLRSLTLTEMTEKNIETLKSISPLLPELSCFRLNNYRDKIDKRISILPKTELRTFTMPELPQNLKFISQLSSITNLTIFNCHLNEIFLLLNNACRLNYLKVEFVHKIDRIKVNNAMPSFINFAIHLKRLVIKSFENEFVDLAKILKQTPSVRSLTIDTLTKIEMIDARQWQDLITSSLPHLIIFKFKFECLTRSEHDAIQEKFQQFRSDFWQKQHHWYTDYSLSDDSSLIYTIPYPSTNYELEPDVRRYCNESINNINTFDNVINLLIIPDALTRECQYHFPHITSIVFGSEALWTEQVLLQIKHLGSLKTIVNLSNVNHLTISRSCELETSTVLLQILKEAQQITSLTIQPDKLILLFNDNELCKYLNKMIKKLDMRSFFRDVSNISNELYQLCKIFSNIEQLECRIDDEDSWLFLITHLPKLSRLNVDQSTSFVRYESSWLQDEVRKIGVRLFVDFDALYNSLSIWIIRDMY